MHFSSRRDRLLPKAGVAGIGVLGILLVGAGLGAPWSVALGALAGLMCQALLRIGGRSTPVARGLASIVAIVALTAWGVAVGIVFFRADTSVVAMARVGGVTAVTVASFGLTGIVSRRQQRDTRGVLGVLGLTTLPVAVYAVVTSPGIGDAVIRWATARGIVPWLVWIRHHWVLLLTGGGTPRTTGVTLLLTLVITMATLWYTVPRLRVLYLLSRRHRRPILEGMAHGRGLARGGLGVLVVGGMLFVVIGVASGRGIAVGDGLFAAIGWFDALRWPLYLLIGACWLGWLVSSLPVALQRRHMWPVRWAPATAGGILAVFGFWRFQSVLHGTVAEPLTRVIDREEVIVPGTSLTPPVTGVDLIAIVIPITGWNVTAMLALVLSGAIALAVACGVLLSIVRIRPSPGGIAAIGLLIAAILLGAVGVGLLVVLAVVGAGIIVWELDRYLATAETELHGVTGVSRPFVVHAMGICSVVCVAIAVVVISA